MANLRTSPDSPFVNSGTEFDGGCDVELGVEVSALLVRLRLPEDVVEGGLVLISRLGSNGTRRRSVSTVPLSELW